MIQYLVENKIKVISGIIALLTTIISSAFAVDSRYAKADDIERFKADNSAQYRIISIQQSRSIENLRKQQIEDKLFELDLKSNPSDVDRAMRARYIRELNEVTKRLESNRDVP